MNKLSKCVQIARLYLEDVTESFSYYRVIVMVCRKWCKVLSWKAGLVEGEPDHVPEAEQSNATKSELRTVIIASSVIKFKATLGVGQSSIAVLTAINFLDSHCTAYFSKLFILIAQGLTKSSFLYQP